MKRLPVRSDLHKDHLYRAEEDGSELCLVRGGSGAYLWIGISNRLMVATFTGGELRNLAHAILREVPAAKRKAKR